MKQKIWGVGLGRTATKSLCKALDILGYKTIHSPPFLHSVENFDAGIEGMCISEYKYLNLRYPNSLFVLTIRDISSWLKSCQAAMEYYPLERIPPESEYYNSMIKNRAARYGSLHYDENTLIENYYRHNHEVINYFKDFKKLLIMNIITGDGWDKLCPFMNIEMPPIDFPAIF